jgi:hypothetical protein
MVNLDTSFGEQLLDVSIRQPVAQVPPHGQQNHPRRESVTRE